MSSRLPPCGTWCQVLHEEGSEVPFPLLYFKHVYPFKREIQTHKLLQA